MKRLYPGFTLLCLLLLIQCKSSSNNNPGGGSVPSITSITPNQVSRGQTAIIGRILGINLGGVLSVTLGDGITVAGVNGISSTEIEVGFSVSVNATAGTRTITVTTSAGSATSSSLLTVSDNRAPIAQFIVTPATGARNTTFVCDATTSRDPGGRITSYKWDLGDNHKANGRQITHQYDSTGTFEIVLTVTDDKSASNQVAHSVEVEKGLAPIARFSVTPQSGDVDTKFVLDGSNSSDRDGTIKKYEWTLGDGTTAIGQIVEHKFRSAGVFSVRLTVVDNNGLQNVLERDVRVEKFNEQKAVAEIEKLMTLFFKRFSKLDILSAEQIVEGWSTSPGCPGRDREIRIIENHQQVLAKNQADIVGPIEIFIQANHVSANATVVAKFNFTFKDGTKGTGKATHDFVLKFEDNEWQICNFSVRDADAAIMKLLKVD